VTPDLRFRRVRALFEAALALPDAERTTFLARLRGEDAALRDEVGALLAADARVDDFLEPPHSADEAANLVGRDVGGFHIVRQIGRGGMGTVWEAEQHAPRRRVALKAMHRGLASARARRRFRFEAELLGSLRHPAIAQVYGAGVLEREDGGPSLPWFALEFVEDARPLGRYADEERLDLRARLRLFLTVCTAVQHAHQRGVIHRDLKAQNVLVDREGHVKVIDFGIARMLGMDREAPGDPEPHAATGTDTLAGDVLGTPDAMSPEQLAGRLDEVDARTDVWALGAMLYELTTGRPPRALSGLSLAEVVRRVREESPPPPSMLVRALPREVDWIAGKAMAAEPAERYAAVSELGRDVERLLAGEPVLAGPSGAAYRLRKLCARHRVLLATGAAALLGLATAAGAAAFAFVKQREAALAAAETRAATAEARAEASVTGRFTHQLVALLERLLPHRADGAPLTAAELIDRVATWVRRDLGDRPALQALLLRAVGQAQSELGAAAPARAALEESVRLARARGPAGERDLVEGLVRLGQACRILDDPAAAERALREALALEEGLLGPDHVKLGPILCELGVLLSAERPVEAAPFFRRALALEIARSGEESGDVAILRANLALLDVRAHRDAAALEVLERALPRVRRHHGADDPRVAELLGAMAGAHRRLGNLARARSLQDQDLAIVTRTLGPEHADAGVGWVNLARIEQASGDLALALQHVERGVAILTRALAPEHPRRLGGAHVHARLLLLAGRLDEAHAVVQAALRARPVSRRGRLARLALVLVRADLDRLAGVHAAALAVADDVLADPLVGKDARLCADAHWARAFALARLGDRDGAAAARARAIEHEPLPAPSWTSADAKLAALLGEFATAMEVLGQPAAQGVLVTDALSDPELADLRAQPEFPPVAEAVVRAAEQRAR